MPSRKRKLLIAAGVYEPEIGGPATFGRTLAEYLAQNWAVTLVTYSKVFNYPPDRRQRFKIVRIWKRIPWGLRHLIYFSSLLKAARKSQIILSLNAVSAGFPALITAKIFGKKLVLRVPGDYAWEVGVDGGKTSLLIEDFQNIKKTGWIGILAKVQTRVCRHSALIMVQSKYLADIVAGWGIAPEKIKVVYNGVDFRAAALTKEEARVKIGLPGNIILSIGRFVPWKGFRMLIKIMPQLLEINPFFRLVIIGDGPDKEILTVMIRNLRLEKKVFLLPKKSRDELPLYLAAADVFVLNTGYEGFSHQILEAMTAGVPVVTTSAGGNREVIVQGENGFMVKYNDEFNLLEAIKAVWQRPELKEHFIENGRKTASHFSVESMLNRAEELLNHA